METLGRVAAYRHGVGQAAAGSSYGRLCPVSGLTKFTVVAMHADRDGPVEVEKLSGPAMRTFFNIAEKWTLSEEEEMGVLGIDNPRAATVKSA